MSYNCDIYINKNVVYIFVCFPYNQLLKDFQFKKK